MPLDHYVSRTHLQHFCSPELGHLLYAIRKRDLKKFTPRPYDICRIEEGSTNAYLLENRAIEEFLNTIEPKYNISIQKLAEDRVDSECIYAIAGFVAYVISCSPAGMRIHSAVLQSHVELRAEILDSQGAFPPPPPQLAGLNLTEMLRRGIVRVDVDHKFPQAMGIAKIFENTELFGNFHWEVLHNDFQDSAYFTSDYPVAIEAGSNPNGLNRIVPLSPSLAIRIVPNRSVDKVPGTFTFDHFTYRKKRLKRKEVANINKLIVRCAEEIVCFRDNHSWVADLVRRNRSYRVEPYTLKTPSESGVFMFHSQRVAEVP